MRKPLLDWHTVDTVLLDLDGTLLDLHFDNYFWLEYLPKCYARYHQIAIDEAKKYLHARIEEYHGTLQWYCLDHWSDLVGMNIPQLKSEIAHKIRTRPNTENFLRALAHAGKHVVLVTNAHRAGLDLKLSCTGIDRWLDTIVSSHDYQQPKESQLFWQALHQTHQFNLSRTLFIDDTEAILFAAQTFGVKQLAHIVKPDSQRPGRESGNFCNVVDFEQIMPSVPNQ